MKNGCGCDVLVTCARFSYQIVRSLGRKGLRVVVVDSVKSYVTRSRYVSDFYVSPVYQEQEAEYADFLRNLILELRPRVVIPVFDFHIVAKIRESIGGDTVFAVDSPDKLSLLDNKESFLEYSASLGIPMPRMLDPERDVISFPLVAKLSTGRSGNGVFFLKCQEELDSFRREYGDKSPFYTEFIEGTDYCVDCVRYGDRFYCSSYRSSGRVGKFQKKPLVGREIVQVDALERYSRQILNSLDFNGVCGFDFISGNDGNAYLLECNPRFTGGLGAEILAGFDIPFILFSVFSNRDIAPFSIAYGQKSRPFFSDLPKFSGEKFEDLFPDDPAVMARLSYHWAKNMFKKLLSRKR